MSLSTETRAYIIALPVTSFVSSCSFAAIGLISRGEGAAKSAELASFIGAYTLVMLPFVAFAGALFGLPVVAILRRFNLIGLPTLLVAGAVAGSVSSALILGSLAIEKTQRVLIWAASIGALPGIAAALIWWYLAEKARTKRNTNA